MVYIESKSHSVAQADLEPTTESRWALNARQSAFLSLSSAKSTGMNYHAWLKDSLRLRKGLPPGISPCLATGWRDGLAVKNTCCSFRGPGFRCQLTAFVWLGHFLAWPPQSADTGSVDNPGGAALQSSPSPVPSFHKPIHPLPDDSSVDCPRRPSGLMYKRS